jgi:hypothetical protein
MLRTLAGTPTWRNLKEKNPARVIISHAFMVGRLQNQIPTRNILSQQQI